MLEFKPIECACDEVMSLVDWLLAVKCNWLIDYDGFGELATESRVSNIQVYPSHAEMIGLEFIIPQWATHVVWYNR